MKEKDWLTEQLINKRKNNQNRTSEIWKMTENLNESKENLKNSLK